MKYADVVNGLNLENQYLTQMKDGTTKTLEVGFNNEDNTYVLYDAVDQDDCTVYRDQDVEEILEVVLGTIYDDYEDEDNVDWKELETVMIQPNVFAYDTKEDLILILKWLNHPIVQTNCYTDKNWEEYVQDLDKEYGVVFYWTEYDEWGYDDPLYYYCKIINGVKEV